jgi:poly-gamma-glutamate capsule biosynthesis protein CapA/YwtB (metallophosphatase superfamily)
LGGSSPTIGLLGDVMLGRSVAAALTREEPDELWAPGLRNLLAGCDLVVCNLECCVSDRGAPTSLVSGKPFFFRAPPPAVHTLDAAGVGAVGLANNHALDFGPDALLDTLRHLDAAAIAAAGAGRDAGDACRGLVVDADGVRLGLVAVSDHPAEYAAGPSSPGIAHADLSRKLPAWLTRELAELRERADVVIAFPHWGPNMSTVPERWQRARARDMLEAGADLVAGHSAHVFHGVERRPRGLVLYDLGDALDDYAVDAQLRNDLGVLALWNPEGAPELELVGLRLHFCRTGLAAGADADWIESRLERACSELGTGIERVDEQRFALV